MPRLPFLSSPKQLNLSGERHEIADAHIYARGQRKSISQIFFDWLRPLIATDKAANPERYGDNATASSSAMKGE